MKEKYIVKQVYCDDNYIYYESLKDDILNNFNNEIFILSNRDNAGINDDLLNILLNNLYNASDYEIEVYYKNSYVNYIIDYLKPHKKLSLKQAINIMQLMKDKDIRKDDFIIKALNITFSGSFKIKLLQGYNQSDWLYMFYNSDNINNDFINYIESVLFNTGCEVFISSEKIDIENIDNIDDIDIDGYYDYVSDYYLIYDNLKDYLSGVIGCNKDDIALYTIKDIKTYTTHKIIYNEVK